MVVEYVVVGGEGGVVYYGGYYGIWVVELVLVGCEVCCCG